MSRPVRQRRGRRRILAGAVAAAVAAAVGTTLATTAGAARTAPNASYTFVLSNNFLGNDWRPQVERLAQLTAKAAPFAGKVNLKVVNSQNTNQAQIADLNSIIQTKPDVLLLIAGSTTAVVPSVERACKAGILVFTLSTPVNVPCVYNLNQDFHAGNVAMGQWMAKVLHGKGSVFVDHGITGLDISEQIESGFRAGLKKYGPGIKVDGTFVGQYAAGPEQSGISNLLVAHPDVSGVMTQGYCTPVFNALKAAGKPPVPAICYGYNGEMTACAQPGHACAILTNTPGQVQLAMKLALDKLQGKKVPNPGGAEKDWIPYPMYLYLSPTPKVRIANSNPDLIVQVLKKNVNFFPKLAAGLSLPYTLPQWAKQITPQQAAGK